MHKLSWAWVKSYLIAVRYAQIVMGPGDPVMATMPQPQYVFKRIHQHQAGKPQRTRLLITPEILQQLRRSWEQNPTRADANMLWGAITLCFSAFLFLQIWL